MANSRRRGGRGRSGGGRSGGGVRLDARGTAWAAVLAVLGAGIAFLCVREAAVAELAPETPTLGTLAPRHPEVVLGRAMSDIVTRRGILPPSQLAGVAAAAQAAPLDARPYLVLGHQRLLDGRERQAVAVLEAGRRRDPRQDLIHLVLVDRYLRDGRYADAATEFSVLSRLVGTAQGPIAAAVAEMARNPDTREATRRTLATDPTLERAVLVALARSDTPPATLFDLAGPVALAEAGVGDSWGPALIGRLAERGRFAEARAIWQRVYRLPDALARAPIYDAGFRGLPGSPPFNWTLAAGTLGAADARAGGLDIDYYGRDSGELASQVLVLAPGAWRLGFAVEGGRSENGASLAWSVRCATGGGGELARVPVVAAGAPRRTAAAFTVPAGCPAQRLSLLAEAGEFPVPIALTVRDLALAPAGGGRP